MRDPRSGRDIKDLRDLRDPRDLRDLRDPRDERRGLLPFPPPPFPYPLGRPKFVDPYFRYSAVASLHSNINCCF